MAHDLDFSRVTGKANMFSVKTVPWHTPETGGGNIIQDAPSFEEALRLAEIDYEVKTMPLAIRYKRNGQPVYLDSKIGQAIVRIDRLPDDKAILGIVGDGYTPLQNREAFEILEPLIDKGLITLQTGGVLKEGADAWLLGKLAIKDKLVEQVFANKTDPFILLSNNHTGKSPVTGMYTPIEVVCRNTLVMAHHGRNKSNSFVLRKHTKNVRESFLESAMLFFEETMDNYHLIAQDYKFLQERILTVKEFTTHVLDVVAPIPVIEKADKTSHSDSVIDRAVNKRDILTQAWEKATGNVGNHSAWEAFMAVTELLDYSDNLVKVRKSTGRVQSMINGPIADMKQEVIDSLMSLNVK